MNREFIKSIEERSRKHEKMMADEQNQLVIEKDEFYCDSE